MTATETLPAAIANLPGIETARLPANYEAVKNALANCEAIDECMGGRSGRRGARACPDR